jgi:hypothetical protein
VDFIETLRQRERELGTDEGELGVTTIHGVAGKDWMIAEIFHLVLAEPAISVGATHPRDSNPHSQQHCVTRALNDQTDNLMPWNQSGPQRWKIALNDMQVGTADSTCDHAQQHITRLKLRTGDVFDSKVRATCSRHPVIHCGFHRWHSCAVLIISTAFDFR